MLSTGVSFPSSKKNINDAIGHRNKFWFIKAIGVYG